MQICSEIIGSVNSDIRGKNFYTALELEKNGKTILKLNTGNPATPFGTTRSCCSGPLLYFTSATSKAVVRIGDFIHESM